MALATISALLMLNLPLQSVGVTRCYVNIQSLRSK
jgi:hypothetical protein